MIIIAAVVLCMTGNYQLALLFMILAMLFG